MSYIELSKEQIDSIQRKYEDGMKILDIANEYNIDRSVVLNRLKKRNVKIRRNGEKITEKEAAQIIKMFFSGMTSIEISKAFNNGSISHDTIRNTLERYLREDYHEEMKRRGKKRFDLNTNDYIFSDLTNEGAAWLFGWLESDGSLSRDGGDINIGFHSKDIELIDKFKSILNAGRFYRHKKKPFIYFRWHSKPSQIKLIELGCCYNKTLVLEMPKIEPHQINWAAYFRGILEGDGWVSINKNGKNVNIGIASGSIIFLKQSQKFLKEILNVDTLIYHRPNSNSNSLRIRGIKSSIIFLKWIYNNPVYFLSRKYNNAMKFLETRKNLLTKDLRKIVLTSKRIIN